ncbi:hypothetical protein GCM10010289_79380 [Streptomyces violascens]|nr:hypothetical protein GCM10010289_79380 [Streptomyces violascens]
MQRDADGRIIEAGDDGDGGREHEGEDGEEPALLRFSTPRDAATIAAFLRTRVYQPQSQVWLEGFQALRRWRAEHHITGLYAVPYDTQTRVGLTTAYPLGRWVQEQRRALRSGRLDDHRKQQLDAEGMVWEPGDEAWETKLALLRSYRRAFGHLAPRQDAVWDQDGEQLAIGQLMANLRRTDGLGKNQDSATTRAAQLTAIDEDWNCPWPLDWQRHHRILRDLAQADGALPDIAPGVTFDGDDLGRWLTQQQRDWHKLSAAQQKRLSQLGITPAPQPPAAPAGLEARGVSKAQQAFQRGLAALMQWIEREGGRPVPRGHAEEITVEGQTDTVVVKLGVWITNTKSRRDKLAPEQRAQLAELGIEWAR